MVFNVHQTAGQPAGWVDLDEVMMGAGLHADLWASAASELAQPGEPVTLTVRYGNRGTAAAATAVPLTLTLPVGLDFVSADPPSLTPAPALSWLPDAPAPGNETTILIRATVAAEIPAGALLTADLAIGPAPGELALENNAGAACVFVAGRRAYLPWGGKQRIKQ